MNKLKRWILVLLMVCTPTVYALEIKGHLVQGGWVQLKLEPLSKVDFGGRQLQADTEGLLLIAFARNEASTKTLTVINPSGKTQTHRLNIAQREYVVQHIDGLPPKHVTPDEATLAKIREDNRKAAEARKINVRTPFFLQGFEWPAEGWITGIYGSQRILNGHARNPHLGVDIAAPVGTPIYAPSAGKVTLVEPMELAGNTIFVDHGYGLRSDFMHLEKMYVKVGDLVEKGQLIATMGATGRATGSHLHWGMSWFDVRIDPASVFNLDRSLVRGAQVLQGKLVYEDQQAKR